MFATLAAYHTFMRDEISDLIDSDTCNLVES